MTSNLEEFVACFLIFSIGILHGANDLKIIKKVYLNKNYNFYRSLTLYVLIVLAGTLMFYFIPTQTLILFILISGYHFGEQHFHNIESKNIMLKQMLFIGYGNSVIFLLLLCNSSESIKIIHQISNLDVSKNLISYALILSVLVFTVGFAMLFKKIEEPLRELFNLLVFYVVFKTASLIWAFAIYFIIWHSLPSILDQIKFLSIKVNKSSIISYIKSSILYWLISVVGLLLFYNFLIKESDLFYSIFFSFLAAITFPHVIVMTKILKH